VVDPRRLGLGVAVLVGAVAAVALAGPASLPGAPAAGPTDAPTAGPVEETPTPTEKTPTEVHADYETTTVRVLDGGNGTELGRVTAAVADTSTLRYTGLSDTESLPEDRGMLFVYEAEANRTFVMREMSFAIDIVFVDADGRITAIHHAPAPGPNEDGEEQRYEGSGKYVLEVNYDWTTERGVEVGDRVVIGKEK